MAFPQYWGCANDEKQRPLHKNICNFTFMLNKYDTKYVKAVPLFLNDCYFKAISGKLSKYINNVPIYTTELSSFTDTRQWINKNNGEGLQMTFFFILLLKSKEKTIQISHSFAFLFIHVHPFCPYLTSFCHFDHSRRLRK